MNQYLIKRRIEAFANHVEKSSGKIVRQQRQETSDLMQKVLVSVQSVRGKASERVQKRKLTPF